jgi:predicted RNA-binding protein with PIN domain
LTHLYEKQHIGVLTGSPITDMRITLVAGRAHNKHTEGGDFRQATYRAVRHGLMQANTILLEPYYRFRLELPREQIGHAIHDIRGRHGSIEPMEEAGDTVILRGRAPVTTMNDYAMVVASYTKGRGRLSFEMDGYDRCHNPEEVVARYAYEPTSDVENTPDSVFCAHGGGFAVKWDRVTEYMHLESCLKKENTDDIPRVIHRNLHLDEKELEAIMLREFGPIKRPSYRPPAIQGQASNRSPEAPVSGKRYLIVDGYNVIFAWEDLKEIAETDLDRARNELMRILSNYSAFTKHDVVLVFDAYKVAGNQGKRFDYHNIHVVFTKERELGDVYIEKLIAEIGKNDNVRVVTSDALIQLSAVRYGVLRMSAAEFALEVNEVNGKISEILSDLREQSRSTIGYAIK